MATPDVIGHSNPFTPTVSSPPRVQPSSRETQASLKRSFAKYLATESNSLAVGNLFRPTEHLQYEGPTPVLTMEDIGFPASKGVSPVAVSEPFRLFSEDAVNIMRTEIMNPEVKAKFTQTSDHVAIDQLRGYAPTHAKFVFEAWKHPDTLAIISKIAGVELVPVMDYEIGHINLSVPENKDDYDNKGADDDEAIVGWHRDSYPFVCVLMMSDTTDMVGGETALRTGTGEIKKVRGPSKGCAVVLQGRYIDHQALRAFGGQERITMVTSFRPRSPRIRDDSVLKTVRPISNLADLYGQTIEYNLENAESRIRTMIKHNRDAMKAGSSDVSAIKAFIDFEIAALSRLNAELVDPRMVVKGGLKEFCTDADGSNLK